MIKEVYVIVLINGEFHSQTGPYQLETLPRVGELIGMPSNPPMTTRVVQVGHFFFAALGVGVCTKIIICVAPYTEKTHSK